MISRAKLSYLRIAPRKVRLVADLIRGEKVEKAQNVLNFSRKKAVVPILKLLNQAVSNAKNKDLKIEEKDLYISEILVNEGPKLKRTLPRSRGRADVMHKKTSHITITLNQVGGKSEKTSIGKSAKSTKKRSSAPKKRETKKQDEKAEIKEEKQEEISEIEKTKEKKKWRSDNKKLRPKTTRGLKRLFRRKAI